MKKSALAYLGPEGTHTHEAAQMFITHYAAKSATKDAYKLVPFPDIPTIMEAVANGSVEQGIVPAENSIEGTVNLTLDILAQELDLYIQGEIVLDITHHLLTFLTDIAAIQTVMSHPQALAQCRHFLKRYLPQVTILQKESTAEAVRLLTKQKHKNAAAIGSFASHQHYRVPIRYANINDFPHNQTRFLLVGKNPVSLSTNTQKTSFVMFPHDNRPGQLYEILSVFAKYQINLSKIESRPQKRELGIYLFWVDCELSLNHPKLQVILNELRTKTEYYKMLGSYPVYR